jgi:hypothetical protein
MLCGLDRFGLGVALAPICCARGKAVRDFAKR